MTTFFERYLLIPLLCVVVPSCHLAVGPVADVVAVAVVAVVAVALHVVLLLRPDVNLLWCGP